MKVLTAVLKAATSTKVAVGLMVVLALFSLVGATVPQGQTQAHYLRAYGGFWGGLVWNLRLGFVFHTDYYTALLVALCVMVVACSLKGLPRRIRASRAPQFVSDDEALLRMPNSARLVLAVDREEADLHVRDVCRRHLYRVAVRTDGEVRTLVASKLGFARFASSVLHMSFVFLLVGGIVMTRLGSRAYEDVRVGENFDLKVAGLRTVEVVVENFDIEFDKHDNVSDFICDVTLRNQGGVILKSRIRPNHPLKYGSREIYLTSYGQDESAPDGFAVSVYDSSGAPVIPHLFVSVREADYVEELRGQVRASAGVVPQVTILFDDGTTETHRVEEDLSQAPGPSGRAKYRFVMMYPVPSVVVTLEVVKEPGQWLILAGFALLTIGAFGSLYLSHRVVWFAIRPHSGGKSQVVFGGRAARNREGFAREFEAMRRTLEELA
jgi:cytochrome c biogenesis protein ResB